MDVTDFTGLAPVVDPIEDARLEGCQLRLEVVLEHLKDHPSSAWLRAERRRLLLRLASLSWRAMIRQTLAQLGPAWRRN